MSREGLLTIGVEEEYQIIDATGQLHAHIDTLLAKAAPRLGDKVKREMMQSVVEVGTTICENVDEARDQLGENSRSQTTSVTRCSRRSCRTSSARS